MGEFKRLRKNCIFIFFAFYHCLLKNFRSFHILVSLRPIILDTVFRKWNRPLSLFLNMETECFKENPFPHISAAPEIQVIPIGPSMTPFLPSLGNRKRLPIPICPSVSCSRLCITSPNRWRYGRYMNNLLFPSLLVYIAYVYAYMPSGLGNKGSVELCGDPFVCVQMAVFISCRKSSNPPSISSSDIALLMHGSSCFCW